MSSEGEEASAEVVVSDILYRFYGKSIPFVSSKDAPKNATLRGYFNSAQALADYAEILLHIQKNLSDEMSPIMVLPHPPQFSTLRISHRQTHIMILSPRTFGPLKDVSELKDYLEYMYTGAAQYDDPQESPVNKACNGIDGALEGTDTLDRIFSGIVDLRGEDSCHDVDEFFSDATLDSSWGRQTCSEMVSPIGIGKNDIMFQADTFNLTEYMDSCNKSYGVVPRPHWITTY
ncbi:prolylcarboxypeptidase-like protein [Citrus sinensis]|nr:prolylcarboxypeptidase-like protein [Citrus sinensis]